MQAKLLCAAGEIGDGAAVDIVSRSANHDEPRAAESHRTPEHDVGDDAGHGEAVATHGRESRFGLFSLKRAPRAHAQRPRGR